ncbi:putative F-box domain-containing protein [Seiridium cardinale]|uniref:F-box domain-containing protein n=1 Tax=Seiridium cardinale TaxID=138064 RepID=A0ABR2XTP5_9PEZI
MAATEFRQFPQLPREIQDMIWVFHEASKPVTRHYFRLNGTDFIYTAVDPVHRTFLRNLHEEKSPKKMRLSCVCKSVYEKIEFAGSVYVTKHSMPISSMWQPPEDRSGWIKASYPSSAYVNFERDIFIFQNPFQPNSEPLDIQSVPDRRINITLDKTITWASHVQHVAVYPRKMGAHHADRLLEIQSFTKTLRDMENLKTVYLVWSPKKRGCAFAPMSTWSGKDVNKAGFVELSRFLKKHRESRNDELSNDQGLYAFHRLQAKLERRRQWHHNHLWGDKTVEQVVRLILLQEHTIRTTNIQCAPSSLSDFVLLKYTFVGGCPNFVVCAGCFAGLFALLNPGCFFERGYAIPGNQPVLCTFNPASQTSSLSSRDSPKYSTLACDPASLLRADMVVGPAVSEERARAQPRLVRPRRSAHLPCVLGILLPDAGRALD